MVTNSNNHRAYAGFIIPMAALLLWEVGARAHLLPEFLIAPTLIIAEFASMAASGELWIHLAHSLFRSLGGFIIGATLGILLGLFAGASRRAGSFFNPLVSIVYPVPKVAFLPILVIWLGLGDASQIAVIAVSVFFPVFINTVAGTRSVPLLLMWVARSIGAGRLRMFLFVMLPASLPHILSGMRLGLGLSYVALFASELFGARSGLGYLIGVAEDSRRFDLMYVAIISIGLLGFLSDRLLLVARRRLLVGQALSKEEYLA
jgi:ABC-type nitrate/sulfonate/bicarbonate transport system permease component